MTGDASFIVDGAPIARAGDVTSCGAKLIAVQQSFCESDFEVMSVEQPAPIQFPKSDPESLFASLAASDDKDSEDEMSDDDLWVWVDVSTEQALEEGGLWAGPGMYGTDEIPGSSAARERARLQGIEDRRQPVGNNDYVNFTKDGNHAYDYISPPVCSIHDPNCSIKSVVNFLNKKACIQNKKHLFHQVETTFLTQIFLGHGERIAFNLLAFMTVQEIKLVLEMKLWKTISYIQELLSEELY